MKCWYCQWYWKRRHSSQQRYCYTLGIGSTSRITEKGIIHTHCIGLTGPPSEESIVRACGVQFAGHLTDERVVIAGSIGVACVRANKCITGSFSIRGASIWPMKVLALPVVLEDPALDPQTYCCLPQYWIPHPYCEKGIVSTGGVRLTGPPPEEGVVRACSIRGTCHLADERIVVAIRIILASPGTNEGIVKAKGIE